VGGTSWAVVPLLQGRRRRPITLDDTNAARYYSEVIRSFRDKESRKLFDRERNRAVPTALRKAALRKLLILDAAEGLEDLRVPPGNRLEKLKGDRSGQHSIRINDRYRICFEWRDGGADAVEIVDYH
jgi:proteic killer suppression protein